MGKSAGFFDGLKAVSRSGWSVLADAVLLILFAIVRQLAETAPIGFVGVWSHFLWGCGGIFVGVWAMHRFFPTNYQLSAFPRSARCRLAFIPSHPLRA